MRRRSAVGWLFVAPAALHLAIFALAPIVWALVLSLYRVDLIRGRWIWTGAGNFRSAMGDPSFRRALINSAEFALMSVPLGMALALSVALLAAGTLRGVAIFRTLFYIPSIASGVAISMLWIYVYLPKTGMINTFLGALGLPDGTDFLRSRAWALPALAFMAAVVGLGPRMVIFSAGLLNIPRELYEAADLDGASKWVGLRRITLPMLAPTTFFVLVTSTIGALQMFTPVYLMTQGGPEDATDVVGYHIYREAWVRFNTGLASAQSFILLVLTALVAAAQFGLQRERSGGYASS